MVLMFMTKGIPRRVISLPFVAVRYIRMGWGCLVANMPNGQATLWIILSRHGLMAILASVSGMSTYLMVHAQITTLKGGTAELRPWQERLT